MIRRILLGLVLLCLGAAATAQEEASDQDKDRQWVTDKLRLSLYEEANAQSRVVKYLSSGDLLEITQVSGPYAFVTAPDGTRGWVKRGFLVTTPTSNLLLQEEQRKNKNLAAEIEKLGNSKVINDQYEKDMDKLVDKIDVLEKEKQTAQAAIDDLRQEIEDKEAALKQKKESGTPAWTVLWETTKGYWEFVVPILLVIIAISFFVSKEIVETRIRSRFHGIKIW